MEESASSETGRATRLLPAFFALASSRLIGTASGFVFWVLVARLAPPSAVGIAGAVIATVALLTRFTSLGLGSFLMVELPKLSPTAARELFRLATLALVAVSAPTALLWGAGVWVFGSEDGSSMSAIVGSAAIAALFVAIMVTTAVTAAWDYGALGIDKGSAQVTRNLIASFGRFPVLLAWPAVVGEVDAVAIQMAWFAPMALSAIVFAVQVRLAAGIGSAPRRTRELLGTHWRTSMGHYFLDVALAAGPLLVPVVAAGLLTSRENGFFTVAWMAASVVFVAPFALGTALFASKAGLGTAAFLHSSRRILPAGLGLVLVGCLGTWVAGSLFFKVFGDEYVEESLPLMSVMVLAGFAMVLKDLLLDWYRLEKRFTIATTIAGVSTALDVTGALLGGILIGGGMGVAAGWVIASGIQVALASPLVVGFVKAVVSAPAPAPAPLA